MWRCANDIFGYCSKEPDWKTPPEEARYERGSPDGIPLFMVGGTCKNDPKTCSYYLTNTRVSLNLVAAG